MDTLSFDRMVYLYKLENYSSRFFFTQENLVSFSGYGNVYVWNLSSGELINQFYTAEPGKGGCHAISLDGKTIFYNFFQCLYACDVLTGKQLFQVVLEREPCAMAALAPEQTGADVLIAMGRDKSGFSVNHTILLKLRLSQERGLFDGTLIPCIHLDFVMVPSDRHPEPICMGFSNEEDGLLSLLASPDGKTILCHTLHPQLQNNKYSKLFGYHQWWDVRRMEQIRWYETSATWTADALALREMEHPQPQEQVHQYLVSGTREGILKVWNLATDQEVFSIPGGKSPSFMTPDGQFLLCATETRETLIWNVYTNQEIRTLPGYPRAISSDARFIIIGSTDGYTEVWGIPHAE